jgi:protein O-GlcNAc transferase
VSIPEQLKRAKHHQRQGQLAEANNLYQQIIKQDSRHAEAHFLMGSLHAQSGSIKTAISWLYKAVQLAPKQAQYRYYLAECYKSNSEFYKAIHYYKQVIASESDNATLLMKLAETYQADHQLDLAITSAEDALKIDSNMVEALNFLGNIYTDINSDKATHYFKKALDIAPDVAEIHYNLGNNYFQKGQSAHAVSSYQQAIKHNPVFTNAYLNLANTLKSAKHYKEALHYYHQAHNLEPDSAAINYQIGGIYTETGNLQKSLAFHQKAYEKEPNTCHYLVSYSRILQNLCDWPKGTELVKKIPDAVRHGAKQQQLLGDLFSVLSMTDNKDILLAVAKSHANQLTQNATTQSPPFTAKEHGDSGSSTKLRIGYLSSDFGDHPVAALIKGVLKHHDRQNFDIVCFSHLTNVHSEETQAIANLCDQFIDITQLNDIECAKQIHANKIDILVELNGQTANNRIAVMYYRPAPIQVSYLGCPGTSGADFIDYIITDSIVTPQEDQAYFTEQFAYLPHTYQATNDAQTVSKQMITKSQYGLPEDGIVFCCFNQTYKIDETCFSVWVSILKTTDDSVLWLYSDSSIVKDNLIQAAIQKGLDPNRLIFAKRVPKPEYLLRHTLVDLALDTLLYNGHTTTSDALYMGIPVVTLKGKSFASRVSSSLLTAIGQTETITSTLQEYESLAIELANTPEKLQHLKENLTNNKKTHPLFQTLKFTQSLEQLYQKMIKGPLNHHN